MVEFLRKMNQWVSALPAISRSQLILAVSTYVTLFFNKTFLEKVSSIYSDHFFFKFSVFVILLSLINIIFSLVCVGRLFKPALIFFILLASLQAYFTDNFGVIGDETMILNVFKTDYAEVLDLLSLGLLGHMVFYGIMPALFVYIAPLRVLSKMKMGLDHIKIIAISLAVIVFSLVVFGKSYASFFREHKPVRYYSNPCYIIYSSFRLLTNTFENTNAEMTAFGADAHLSEADTERELVIFVLGETARSDRFSLNGYSKETNPLLKKEGVISFKDVYACGTSTAISVPCMFSVFGRDAFNHEKADGSENLVDVLHHTGRINILWRDNNSNSKGVALRVPYQDFKTPKTNPVCDEECRDEGMLVGLQEYINNQKNGDIFIVLHQMGNHGPAYFKRYPEEFEIFKPACKSIELGNCSNEEINNAYDNAITYTDYFLTQVIQFLKKNDSRFETAMFYVSDHGESLGENGIYLHGLPYSISPIEQRKVPLILWFGDHIKHDIDMNALKSKLNSRFTHDNVFHTILGLLEVETSIYDETKNIIDYIEVD